MNVTISVDDALLERARDLARRRGMSLQELLRQHLETLVGETRGEQVADELIALMRARPGHSGGRKLTRDDAYVGRV